MLRCFALWLLPLILGAANTSAPTITGVVNAASNRAPGLSASGIAQGSIFTIYGSNLGPNICGATLAFPLQTTMCGVTLTVTVNGTSTAPIPIGVFGYQINAILPSLTPTGTGTITVTYAGQPSVGTPIQVVSAAFGTFTPTYGYGSASVTDTDYKLNTIIHTLHPGDVGVLWGTGLGPIAASDGAGVAPGNLPGPFTVYVGNTPVAPSYAGRSGCCAGLDQVVFTVPSGVQGCYVPIAVQAGGAVGNIGTIAVAPVGQDACSDSVIGQDLINKLAGGNKVDFGNIRLESINLTFSGLTISGSVGNGDYAYATFSEFTPQTAFYAEYGVSSGYCTMYNSSDLSIAQLDAGSGLSLQGPLLAPGPIAPAYAGSGSYALLLTQSIAKFLYSDVNYTVAGTGGSSVGAFTVTDTTSLPDAKLSGLVGQSISRSSDLTVQWTGGNSALENGQVTIAGYSGTGTDVTSVASSFICKAPVSAQRFTIPSWVLSTLPASGSYMVGATSIPIGYIWIGQDNQPTTFQASGLDRGVITDVFYQGVILPYQ